MDNLEFRTDKRRRSEEALGRELPDLENYFAEGSIEIVTHDEWFLKGGAFDLQRVANQFKEKLDEAVARGYAGMRVNGSPAWLQKEDPTPILPIRGRSRAVIPQ